MAKIKKKWKSKMKVGRWRDNEFWERGQVSAICEIACVPKAYMYDVIARRRTPRKERALILEQASKSVLGFAIPWVDWLFNQTTTHPAFRKAPKIVQAYATRPVERLLLKDVKERAGDYAQVEDNRMEWAKKSTKKRMRTLQKKREEALMNKLEELLTKKIKKMKKGSKKKGTKKEHA